MSNVVTTLVIIFIVGAALLLFSGLYSVEEKDRGVIERFGKYRKFVKPGLHFKIPFIDKLKRRDIREDTIEIAPQGVITKDNVEIKVDGIFWCRVDDSEEMVKRSFYAIDNYILALTRLAQTNIREEYGKMNFDEALTSRERVGKALITILEQKANLWGVDVTAVEIQTIDPPHDIKAAMHKEKTAEQDRRAMRKVALGRKEAAEQEKEAEILRAEGKAQGTLLQAEAEAKAVQQIAEAAEKYFTERAMTQRKLDVIENTFKNSTKLILPANSSLIDMIGLESLEKLQLKAENKK